MVKFLFEKEQATDPKTEKIEQQNHLPAELKNQLISIFQSVEKINKGSYLLKIEQNDITLLLRQIKNL